MRALKWLGITILAIVGIAAAALTWLINARPDLSEFENLYAPAAQGNVTVRFFGTSSMLFSDGETNIMIDGWFTRPSTIAIAVGKVEPDVAAIELGLSRLGTPRTLRLSRFTPISTMQWMSPKSPNEHRPYLLVRNRPQISGAAAACQNAKSKSFKMVRRCTLATLPSR